MTNLMSNGQLKRYKEKLAKRFEIGIIKDYLPLKKSGEEFLREAYALRKGGLFNEFKLWKQHVQKGGSFNDFILQEIKYRLFLGVAVELIVKAAFLKQGYIINSYKNLKQSWYSGLVNLFVSKNKPLKFEEVVHSRLITQHTQDISYFIDHINFIFPNLTKKECNTYIRKGLEIARIWRNKEIHLASGSHSELIGEDEDIKTAIHYIYQEIFDDEKTINLIML
ncbi:MAG: hypothetical protein PHO02_05350 [Candidatus Nanoarchaeia archaeon]|nr:hypothetical protein [Candidatus Nanoarchaeia archaeon]